MMIFTIANHSTEADINEFMSLFQKYSTPERCVEARINYSFPIPSPNSDPTKFPLTIQTDDGIMYCVLNVTAGYGGEGPHGMCKILSQCGFRFDKDLIFENSGGEPVRFTLTKTPFGPTKYSPVAV